MAHSSSLTRWLVGKRQAFEVKINDFDWSNKWSTQMFDFQVQISVDGRTFTGRGTDQNEALALEKACAEAIERGICGKLKISSRGVAVHPEAKEAILNSRQEALERAIFDWHLNSVIPFKLVEPTIWMKQLQALPIQRDHLGISFYESAADFNQSVTICQLSEDGQNFLGLALDSNSVRRLDKSMIEAVRNLFAYRESPKQFVESVINDPDMWCADPKFISKITPLLGTVSSSVDKSPKVKLATIVFEAKDLGPYSDAPLTAARTSVELL